MNIIKILCVVFLLICTGCRDSSIQTQKIDNKETAIQPEKTENKEQTYSTISVNMFSMTLKNINGKCILSYKNERNKSIQTEQSISMDIAAPCEFIRNPSTLKPLFYVYGKKIKKHVLIVTGGEPDPTSVNIDKFQPQGCGTSLQKIIIFDDKIETGEKSNHQNAYCPSAGIDEVFFAA